MEIAFSTAGSSYNLHTAALQGLQGAAFRMSQNASQIAGGDISVERMVSLNQDQFLYSINIQLLKISDEMVGELLEILA